MTVFDDLSHGHRAAVPTSIELVVGDVGDAAALDAVFGRRAFEVVMHFAGLIEAGESMKVPERYFRANSAGALSLLEAMLRHGVGRLVFSSTAALFGNPERTPVTEDGRMQPTNAYGASKLLIEQMLPWMNTAHGLRFACLRYFNAAGARDPDNGEDHRPETHLIPLVLKVASGQRENVSVFGGDYPTPDGSCVRDYIHVDDLARAHLLAMTCARRASNAPLQSRQRRRFFGAASHSSRARGDRPSHSLPRGGASGRRSRHAGGVVGEHPRGVGLATGDSGAQRHHRQRLGMASAPSPWL